MSADSDCGPSDAGWCLPCCCGETAKHIHSYWVPEEFQSALRYKAGEHGGGGGPGWGQQ